MKSKLRKRSLLFQSELKAGLLAALRTVSLHTASRASIVLMIFNRWNFKVLIFTSIYLGVGIPDARSVPSFRLTL
jgi:hypothetical protein